MHYQSINREERSICSHLFRLLFNSVHTEPEARFFRSFVQSITRHKASESKLIASLGAMDESELRNAQIFTEVALVRDVLAAGHLSPQSLEDYCRTSESEPGRVEWSFQQMLCVKPDLAIVLPGLLIVVEAKFTLPLEHRQLARTESLVAAWRDLGSPWQALGLDADADAYVVTLANAPFSPHLDWQTIAKEAETSFGTDDPSVKALMDACELLSKYGAGDDSSLAEDGYTIFQGLCALERFLAEGNEGYVGFLGGRPAVLMALEEPDYLETRKYKWLPTIDNSKQRSANWIPAQDFLGLVRPDSHSH